MDLKDQVTETIKMIRRVIMTCHLTLFLACFSVIFSMFYIHNRGVLEKFLMISGHL